MIWILGALLVIATLDNIPDPPAATPSASQFCTTCLYEYSVAVVTPNGFVGALFRLPLTSAVADAVARSLPNRSIVLIDYAADLPPPSQQSQRA
jgi:hypothetical protein